MLVHNKVKIYDAVFLSKTLHPICRHYKLTTVIKLLLYSENGKIMNYDTVLFEFFISFVYL